MEGAKALDKVYGKTLDDGSEAHSFRTLLHHMSTITRDLCRRKCEGNFTHTFSIDTTPNEKQRRMLDLLGQIKM